MSFPLLRLSLKRHGPLCLVFLLVLCLYLLIIGSMYDPTSMQAMDGLLGIFPEQFISALGFQLGMTTLNGFLTSFFFGFLVNMLSLFYTLLLTNSLMVKLVDNGSMSYLLNTPTSRGRIAGTQMAFLYGSLLLLFGVTGGLCIPILSAMFPGQLDVPAFLRVLGYACLVSFAVASLCMFFSCLFSTSRTAVACSTGLTVLFILLQMIGNMGPTYARLKRFTPYGWMDAMDVMNGAPETLVTSVVLLVISAVLSSAGYVVFTRKQLAI